MSTLHILKKLGFTYVGEWSLSPNEEIKLDLVNGQKNKNVLYSFVVNDNIQYIGKTIMELQKRLYGYKNPGESQRTNRKNNIKIKKILLSGGSVKVYALMSIVPPLQYKGFQINIAAGLEDILIKEIKPIWNNLGK